MEDVSLRDVLAGLVLRFFTSVLGVSLIVYSPTIALLSSILVR